MRKQLPNLLNFTLLFLCCSGVILTPPISYADTHDIRKNIIQDRLMQCLTLKPEHEYQFIPPSQGRLVRFGINTLCYVSEYGVAVELYFVETDQNNLVTDAGVIYLPTTGATE